MHTWAALTGVCSLFKRQTDRQSCEGYALKKTWEELKERNKGKYNISLYMYMKFSIVTKKFQKKLSMPC